MRRCIHACLVGILTLSLSMDAARACWFLRHGCRSGHSAGRACPPAFVVAPPCTPCSSSEPIGGACEFVPVSPPCGECDACGEGTEVVIDGVADEPAGAAIVTDTVAVPHAEPTPAEPSEIVDRPATPSSPAASAVVPDLKPAAEPAMDVRQAVAIDEPAGDPAPHLEPTVAPAPEPTDAEPAVRAEPVDMPEEPVAAPRPEPSAPVPSAELNLFEEADAEPADEAADPAADVPAVRDSLDAPTPEPAVDPAPSPPANPLDAAARRAGEPARLWVDATGRHSVVGVLVDVRGDGVCVLDTGAGMLEVRSADLRRRDRDYATQASERLAARRGPAAADTAAR